MPSTTEQPVANRFLRPQQIIRERHFPRTRLYDDLAKGLIRHVRLNRSILIEEAEFDAYVDRLSVGGDKSAQVKQLSVEPNGDRSA